MKKPSEMLLESRRCIDEFSQVELITDLAWDVDDLVWAKEPITAMLERTERILFRGVAFASRFKSNSKC